MCVAIKKVRERGGCKWFADRVKAGRAKKRARKSQRKKSNGFAHTPWLWTRARGGVKLTRIAAASLTLPSFLKCVIKVSVSGLPSFPKISPTSKIFATGAGTFIAATK